VRSFVVLACVFGLATAGVLVSPPGHHVPKVDNPALPGDGRIVGGEIVTEGQFPHQIAMFRTLLGFKSFSCGASLISPTHVLTAAHCIAGVLIARNIAVRAGEHHLDSTSYHEQERTASKLTIHPQYSSSLLTNDIGIIEVSQPFELNEFVQPIQLAPAGEEYEDGDTCVVSGWGTTSEGGVVARYLRAVEVPYVDDEACNNAYVSSGISVTDTMLCAGERGKDACQGDSGGPILCGGNGTLSGIVSWGNGCAREGFPGVYTQVSKFRDFIKEVTGV